MNGFTNKHYNSHKPNFGIHCIVSFTIFFFVLFFVLYTLTLGGTEERWKEVAFVVDQLLCARHFHKH